MIGCICGDAMKRKSLISIALMTAVSMLASSFAAFAADDAKASKSATAGLYDADESIMAYAVFGENTETKNMKIWMGDENAPVTIMHSGKSCWNLSPSLGAQNRYIYVDLDDNLVNFGMDGHNIEVTVEYFDKGIGSLVAEYPDLNTKNRLLYSRDYNEAIKTVTNLETDILDFADSKTWKKHTWLIQHPSLRNDMNGADFRFGIYSPDMYYSKEDVYVASVTVSIPGERSQLGIDISSDHLGNIFFTDEEMNFDIEFDNSINPSAASRNGKYTADVEYTITDEKGNTVFEKNKQLEINPKATTKDTLTYKPEKYGLYVLKVSAYNKKLAIYSEETRKCSYSFTTHGKIKNPRAGTSTSAVPNDADKDGIARLVANAGYSYARHHFPLHQFGVASFGNKAPTAIEQHQSYTRFMADLAKYGVINCGYLGGAADVNTATMFDNSGTRFLSTQEGIDNYYKYNLSTLERFGDALGVYAFDNEVNLWGPKNPYDNAKVYADAVMNSYPKFKEMYPDKTFLVGESGGMVPEWWEELFEYGVADCLDAISIHNYNHEAEGVGLPEDCNTGRRGSGSIYKIRELMEKYGIADKEVWVTETGYSSYYTSKNITPSNYKQACWSFIDYCIQTAPGTFDKVFNFSFTDGRLYFRGEREYNFGKIEGFEEGYKNRFAAKEAYLQESAMNIFMYDAENIGGRIMMGDIMCYRYNKTNTGKQMAVITCGGEPGEARQLSLDLGVNNIEFYDMYGNVRNLTSTDGCYTFTVDMEPFYIIGDFTKFEQKEASAVMPVKNRLSAEYGDSVEIEFVNESGKDLAVTYEFMAGTEIKPGDTMTIPAGGGKLSFDLGSAAPRAFEPVRVTLTDDDGKIYFDDDIVFEYIEALDMTAALKIDSNNKWYFDISITNDSTVKPYEGVLKLVSPENMSDKIEKKTVVVNPGETVNETLYLIEKPDNVSSLKATLAFITNEESNKGAFYSSSYDFAYAPMARDEIKIDADLSEWKDGWMYMNTSAQFEAAYNMVGNTFFGADDLWARVAVKWDKDNFYFAGEVHDDKHFTDGVGASQMWQVDDFQLGITYDPDNKLAANKFEEISFALLDKPTIFRHLTSFDTLNNDVPGAELAIVTSGKVTNYELKIPWTSIIPNFAENNISIEAGNDLKFSLLLNENDGNGRKGFYKIGDGIANSKNSSQFVKLYITE